MCVICLAPEQQVLLCRFIPAYSMNFPESKTRGVGVVYTQITYTLSTLLLMWGFTMIRIFHRTIKTVLIKDAL